MAITSTEQTSILNLIVSMFNAAPGAANLTSIAAAYEANGKSLTTLANSLAMSSAFTDQFAGLVTDAAVANKMAANFGLTSGTAYTNAYNYFVAELAAGHSKASIMKAANDYLMGTHDAMFNDAAATLTNKTTVALDYSVTKQLSGATIADLRAAVSGVDATAASVTTKIAASTSTPGSTFTLTTAAEILSGTTTVAANKTTDGNDTIYALTAASFTSADVIDGGNGTDSLTAVYAATADLAPVLTSVENLTLRQSANASTTYNAANTTGLTSLTFDSISEAANATAQSATNLGATVTTLGITNVTSTDADTFTFTYADAAVAGTANAVTLNVTNVASASGVVVIQNTTATTTTAGAGVETVTVNTQGTGTAAASTLASLKSTDSSGTASVLTTLNVTGTSNLTVTAALDFAGTTGGTIVATGMSGNLTLKADTNEGVTFTGGTGKNAITTGAFANTLTGGSNDDTFTLGAGTDKVTGGAGNDTVVAAIASLTALDTIALGDGTQDAIIYTNVTTLDSTGVIAANLAILNGYTGVEAIGTAGALTAVDASYFNQNIYVAAGALTAAVTMTNVANDTLLLSSGITGVNADALTVSGSLPNQTFNLVLKGAAGINLKATDGTSTNSALVTASGLSTVNIISDTTSTTAVTNTISTTAATTATHTIDNVSAGSFVLTGATNLTIASGLTAGFTKAVDFDAHAFTGVLTISGSDSADIIKGGTKADIITGLKGADQLTGNGGNDVFTFTAAGVDWANAGTTAADLLSEARTITDFTAGDSIDFGATTLAAIAHTATAVSGTASISATGLATFNTADNTLALKLAAVVSAMAGDAVGTSAVFTDGTTSYLYVSEGSTAIDATDALIKLSGVTAATGLTFTGTDITGVA